MRVSVRYIIEIIEINKHHKMIDQRAYIFNKKTLTSRNILTLLITFVLFVNQTNAQQFQNIDLEGDEAIGSMAPEAWDLIPFTDPLCWATFDVAATSDLLDENGPFNVTGAIGYPYSGELFVSGILTNYASDYWHEGIQQEVSGFIVGQEYSISFFQTVVRQLTFRDTSGFWNVYVDDALVGSSEVSVSAIEYNDINLVWDERYIVFTATSETQMFKFLPFDDDSDNEMGSDNMSGGLRMGIDLITLFQCNIEPPHIDIVDDVLVTDSAADSYVWIDCDTDEVVSTSSEFSPPSSGSFMVWITIDGCISISDCLDYSIVNIDEYRSNELLVYPNPAREEIEVFLPENTENKQLKIRNCIGALVYQGELFQGKNVIPVSLASGVYFLVVEDSDIPVVRVVVY